MSERVTEESAGIPAELILVLVIFFILIFILGGGTIEGIFSLFKGLMLFVASYLISGLKTILHG